MKTSMVNVITWCRGVVGFYCLLFCITLAWGSTGGGFECNWICKNWENSLEECGEPSSASCTGEAVEREYTDCTYNEGSSNRDDFIYLYDNAEECFYKERTADCEYLHAVDDCVEDEWSEWTDLMPIDLKLCHAVSGDCPHD